MCLSAWRAFDGAEERLAPVSRRIADTAINMTLFVITLGLNIVALWIVRKYQEQYE